MLRITVGDCGSGETSIFKTTKEMSFVTILGNIIREFKGKNSQFFGVMWKGI